MAPMRPVARGLFVFISPAAVVGERLAGEEFGIVRGRLAGEQHDDFAAHVDALVIVPLVLGRDNAMADEHGVGVEFDVGFLLKGDADEIVEPLERRCCAPAPVALI